MPDYHKTAGASVKDWILSRIVDAIYPSILLWNNPFKIYEYGVLMRQAGLARTDTVLDLGCGGGLHTYLLAKQCRHATGLDISERWIQRAQLEMHRVGRGEQVELICAPIEQAGLSEGSFDKIFSFSVLEHIPNYEAVLKECLRVLRPGGSIHFSVDWLDCITDPELVEKHRVEHGVVRYFSPTEMHDLLAETGFSQIEVGVFVSHPRSVEMFRHGIQSEFNYTYTGAALDAMKLRWWERSRPKEEATVSAVYLHVRAFKGS